VEDGEEVNEFGPIILELATIEIEGFGLGSQGDFLQFILPIPIEVEVAVEAANCFLGFEGAIETDAGDHDGGDRAFHDLALAEFLDDNFVGVSKFEGIKCRAFWSRTGRFLGVGVFHLGGVIGTEPCLIISVKLLDGEGEDTPGPAESDQFSVVRNVGGFEGFISGGALPWPG